MKEKCIYNTIIKKVLPHAGVKFGKLKRKKVLALEMEFWRRSARTSRREKVRNEMIKKMDIKIQFLMTFGQNSLVWASPKN
jgi:hypothetical protein